MCGRFSLTADTGAVASAFDVARPFPPLSRRYNVAPSQVVAVVGLKPDGRRGLALLRWGLVAHWETTARPKYQPINVRSESARWKFGYHLRGRRCLVPSDGFYEWRGEGKRKVPFRFTLTGGGGVFAFAGLWDLWTGKDGTKLLTCAILTTAANKVVKPFHERMPVIVGPDGYARWLDPGTSEMELVGLMKPYPAELMAVGEAGPAVNSVKNDSPSCLAPAA